MRIFVSSPSDVAAERKIALQVIARLRAEFKHHFDVKPVLWEHEPLLATAHFQEGLIAPSECEVMVCILWSTLGSPLPDRFKRDDGSTGVTGTEWEFQISRNAFLEHQHPEILVYRKTRQVQISLADGAAVDRARERLQEVDRFFDRYFHNPDEDKTFKAAYFPFDDTDQFEDLLYTHLAELLRRHVSAAGDEDGETSVTWVRGSPFRGLRSFELEHAEVFFGRSRARNDLIQQFQNQVVDGNPFLMVLGASGTGKSSLVKAGLLPLLLTPGVIPRVAETRWCVLKPSDGGEDLGAGILRALLSDTALPELLPRGESFDSLKDRVSKSPHALEAMIFSTLGSIKQRIGYKAELNVRMLLIIDQFEELFALPGISDQARAEFISLLRSLVASGHTWVIGTMRSDFFAPCEAFPELLELMRGHGQYHLHPPAPEEVEQMIRLPARAAGLGFERNEQGIGLDAALRESAAREPAILPLLSFTLEELYNRRSDRGVLTWRAYQELGGIEGAVTRRATETLKAVPLRSQQQLPALLSSVITLGGRNAETASGKAAAWSFVAQDPDRKRLAEAFIDARLLIVSDDPLDAGKTVRLAHEALLRRWSKAKDWIDRNQEFLRARARIVDSAHYWELEGRPRPQLIPEGRLLELAAQLISDYRADLDAVVVEYIGASQHEQDLRMARALEQERQARARRRRFRMIAAAVLVLILGAAAVAWQGQRQSRRLQEIQQRNSALAAARAAATFIDAAEQELASGNFFGAASLAMRALQDSDQLNDELLTRALTAAHLAVTSRPASHDIGGGRILAADLIWQDRRVRSLTSEAAPIEVRAAWTAADRSRVLLHESSGELSLWTARPFVRQRLIARDLDSDVLGLAADASYAFYGDEDGFHRLPLAAEARTSLSAVRRPRSAEPVGEWLLIETQDGRLTAWNGERVAVLKRPVWDATDRRVAEHDAIGSLTAIGHHPEPARLLTRSDQGVLELWDAGSGDRLARIAPSRPIIGEDGIWFGEGQLTVNRMRWSDGWVDRQLTAEASVLAFDRSDTSVAAIDRTGGVFFWNTSGALVARSRLPLRGADQVDLLLGDHGDHGFLVSGAQGYRLSLADGSVVASPKPILGFRAAADTVFYAEDDRIMVDRLTGELTAIEAPAGSRILAVSDDATSLVTTVDDHTLQVWDARSGRQTWEIPVEGRLARVELADDGGLAVVESSDGRVAWNLRPEASALDWRPLQAVADADRWQGRLVVAHGTELSLRSLTAPDVVMVRRDLDSATGPVRFSSDGQTVIAGTASGEVHWLNAADLTDRAVIRMSAPVGLVEPLPSGRVLLSTSASNELFVWSVGRPAPDYKVIHWGIVAEAQMSADEALLATRTRDGAVNLWDGSNGQFIERRVYARDSVSAIGFRDRELEAFVNVGASRLKVRAPDTGATLLELDKTDFRSAVASVDSSRLSLITASGVIELWDTLTGSRVVRFNPDGPLGLFSGGQNGDEPDQDDDASQVPAEPEQQPDQPRRIRQLFSPDGKLLIVQAQSGRIEARSAETGELLLEWVDSDPGEPVGFDINNTLLITQTTGGENRYWSLADGQAVRPEGRPRPFTVQTDSLVFEVDDRIARIRPFADDPVAMDQWVNADRVLSTSQGRALVWKSSGHVELIDFGSGESIRMVSDLDAPPSYARLSIEQSVAFIGAEHRIVSVPIPSTSVRRAATALLARL